MSPRSEFDFLNQEVSTGTTLIAAEFDGGVVLGADSRTSMGSFVSNRVTDKLTRVSDKIYCGRSGSAADTQAIADIVEYHLEFQSTCMGSEPLVKAAANVFKDICYSYRDQLMAGILVAGYDEKKGGQIYAVPLGGMIVRQPLSIGGSGSTFLYGFMDDKFHTGMNQEECADLVLKAVALAINRDGSSGGVVRLAIITKDGVERRLFTGDEIPKFFEESGYAAA